jgi:NAD(P)-dependent dehydrogenase (short-subunit alcohol dehydrogenase family)
VAVDLSSPTGPAELVTAALRHAPVDILINNVGAVTPRLDGFLAITDEEWTHSLTRATNITGEDIIIDGGLTQSL